MSRPRFSRAISDDLMAAIDELVAQGLDVTISSVARQAGHSRSLISDEGTAYSSVRERILEIKAETARSRRPGPGGRRAAVPVDQELASLRREVKRLGALASSLQSALAANAAAASASGIGAAGRQLADLERRRAGRAQRNAAEAVS